MVADPAVNQGVSQQVDALPTWLLPLWANWPLVLEGLVMLGVMLFVLVRISPTLKHGFQNLTQKMIHLDEQVGTYRRDTKEDFTGLHLEISELKERVLHLEETIQKHDA